MSRAYVTRGAGAETGAETGSETAAETGATPGVRARRAAGSVRAGTLAAIALSLLLGACSSRSGDTYRELYGPPGQAVPGASARQCAYLQPDRLPSVDEATRLGTRGDLVLWGYGADPSDSVVVSVRYDLEGELEWVRPIHSTLPADRVDALEQLLRRSIVDRGPRAWGYRLRVAADGRDAEVLPSVICPARLERVDPASGRLFGTGREMAEAARLRGRRINVEVVIDEMGRVIGARLAQTSGSRIVDDSALDFARSASFQPELHDGFGVVTTLTFPVRYGRRY